MANLDDYRAKIDEIDKELIKLFEERMNTAYLIGKYKEEHNLPVLNSNREKIVIENAAKNLNDKNLSSYTADFFENMMRISKQYQSDNSKKSAKIAFFGTEGSFTYEAALEYAKKLPGFSTIAYDTAEGVFRALLNDDADVAVIPFENSTTGAVTDVYDLLLRYDFFITDEIVLKVSQHLMAKKGVKVEDIKTVYSHPQAISQCKKYLDDKNITAIPSINTAISAKEVSESDKNDIAAIASESAAKIYNLDIIAGNINTELNNYTKFIVLSKREKFGEDNDKISAVISIDHKSGMLYNVIKVFKDNNINLTKIESRPDHKNPFEYLFFVDFDGNISDKKITETINELKSKVKSFKYLGNYKGVNM
ncbi:MAG: prephenate dehydratase [Ruminococcaceae bacterium]|nr:prephenate dehydratase [Oscillospiraceae bacterium]